MDANPYQSPASQQPTVSLQHRSAPFSVARALMTILVSAFVFAAVGTLLGIALGYFVPEYYRSVFPTGRSPGFDPLNVGIGQGLTQGAAGGLLVGLALVAIGAWQETRRGPTGS